MEHVECSRDLMVEFLCDAAECTAIQVDYIDRVEEAEEDEPAIVSIAVAWAQDPQGSVAQMFFGWLAGRGIDIGAVSIADFNTDVIDAGIFIMYGDDK